MSYTKTNSTLLWVMIILLVCTVISYGLYYFIQSVFEWGLRLAPDRSSPF
ncbi:MAG TPA: hypothetical protein PK191_02635 [Niabella sp.]|nr:hypothetical protein [Niabella sp.]HOZ96777.1 hypothetical protein [Niabella sp.]HQW14746.1 hypothetical protein [Niabella sp.]HQX20002.1 hypothetical protein [Niabella sp.]HQX40622.1 hypothetical protein [Niabella sp.]